MGQAKRRGTFEERLALAGAQAAAKQWRDDRDSDLRWSNEAAPEQGQ